jgi:hypothetical protein
MLQREIEAEKRKIERVLAAAGGASVGVGIGFFLEFFRIIGGPTLVAQILRTPGMPSQTCITGLCPQMILNHFRPIQHC